MVRKEAFYMTAKGKRVPILLIMAILFLGSSFSYASAQENEKVILVLINQLSFTDQALYQQMPGFKNLEEQAAKGAMNINSAGTLSDGNSYLSIGGGSKGVGIREQGNSFNGFEEIGGQSPIKALDVYRQQTGKDFPIQDIIYLSIEKLYNEAVQKFPFYAGALGDTLENARAKVFVYGNNDTDQAIRYAPLITMNRDGISRGNVSIKTLIKDDYRPYGVKTNYSYLQQVIHSVKKEQGKSLIVIDLGDIYRLEQFKKEMNVEYQAKTRSDIYYEIGKFIQNIMNEIEKNQTLIVASPMISTAAEKEGKLLAPIWVYQKGNQENGSVLYSNTTKRAGIVANIDLAPTILSYLKIDMKPKEVFGQTITTVSTTTNLDAELEHIATIFQLRQKVLYTYVMWQVFILLFAAIAWISKWSRIYPFIQKGLLSMLFSPILLLITAYWTPSSGSIYVLSIILFSLIIAFFLSKIKSVPKIFLVAGLLTFIIITIDILSGTPFMRRSFLGYDPIIGARYYGIGNEFMGVYIGATLLFTGALIYLKKNVYTLALTGIVYLLLNFLLISPTLGTNAGGAISAMLATSFIILRFSGLTLNKKGLFYLTLLLVLGMGALIVINYFAPSEAQSHIGRAVSQLISGDITSVFQTVQRKLAMNWRLIQVSSWSKVLASALLAMVILFLKPVQPLKRFLQEYSHLSDGFLGILVGGLTALVVNDSGIVAAATMIIFMAIPLLYIGFTKKERS